MLSFKQDWNPKVDIPALFCNSPWTSATTKSCNFSIFCIKFVSYLEFDNERYRTFFWLYFSCYMYCVDLYVSKTFVYVYLCCYSQKRFIIWKENQIILSCASAVAPPLLGTAPNPQKRVGGSGCHCNRLYHVAHNFWKLLQKSLNSKLFWAQKSSIYRVLF